MEDIIDSEDLVINALLYYLPQHCDVRPGILTTKLRVVFEASWVDPVVQNDLVSIILQFRLFWEAIVSDIEKMYRRKVYRI